MDVCASSNSLLNCMETLLTCWYNREAVQWAVLKIPVTGLSHTFTLSYSTFSFIIVMRSKILHMYQFEKAGQLFLLKANQKGLYIPSLIQLRECQKHSSASPQRPHYPLNFQLFQRQMSTPGILSNPVNDELRRLSHPCLPRWRWMGWWSKPFSVFIPTGLKFK